MHDKSCKQLMPITPDETLDNTRCESLRETAHHVLSSVFASSQANTHAIVSGIIPCWTSSSRVSRENHMVFTVHLRGIITCWQMSPCVSYDKQRKAPVIAATAFESSACTMQHSVLRLDDEKHSIKTKPYPIWSTRYFNSKWFTLYSCWPTLFPSWDTHKYISTINKL